MVTSVVQNRQFWMVISVVNRRQFWWLLTMAKIFHLRMVITVVKRGSFG